MKITWNSSLENSNFPTFLSDVYSNLSSSIIENDNKKIVITYKNPRLISVQLLSYGSILFEIPVSW